MPQLKEENQERLVFLNQYYQTNLTRLTLFLGDSAIAIILDKNSVKYMIMDKYTNLLHSNLYGAEVDQ